MISQTSMARTKASMKPQLKVLSTPIALVISLGKRMMAFSEMFLVASALPSFFIAGSPAIKLDR